jgi:hypothetical protein
MPLALPALGRAHVQLLPKPSSIPLSAGVAVVTVASKSVPRSGNLVLSLGGSCSGCWCWEFVICAWQESGR